MYKYIEVIKINVIIVGFRPVYHQLSLYSLAVSRPVRLKMMTVNTSQYTQVKSLRAQSASPEGGHSDSAFSVLLCVGLWATEVFSRALELE